MASQIAAVVVLALAFLAAGIDSYAATLVVTKTADTADGICDSDCSLREAVAAAASGDTVVFSPLFNEPQAITLALGNIAITRNLTISGTGPSALTISGNNATRILFISDGATVNISGVKLANGFAAGAFPGRGGAVYITDSFAYFSNVDISNNVAPLLGQSSSGSGGGIHVLRGSLSVVGSTISNNTAVVAPGDSLYGGGIYGIFSEISAAGSTISYNQPQGIAVNGQTSQPATVNVTNCSITNNVGTGVSAISGSTNVTGSIIHRNRGGIIGESTTLSIDSSIISENHTFGGIGNSGTATISNTSIKDNVRSGTNALGGGIFNVGAMYVLNSSITGNRSFQSGGGIFAGGGQDLYLTNSTVSGNIADNGSGNCNCPGGGVYILGAQHNVVLTNSTVAENRAGGAGGGIYETNPGTVRMRNTIVAENLSPTSSKDIAATVVSEGFNLVGNTTGSLGWITSDLLNKQTFLGPLANNGGPSLTHAVLPSSPAINAGNNDLARNPLDNTLLANDQRGYARVINGAVDIGAYEANYPVGPVSLAGRVVVSPTGRGVSKAYVTLTDALGNVLYTQTNPFGHYRFLNLLPGTTYSVRVSNKSYVFDSPQVVTIDQPRDNFDFVALGQ